MKETIYPQRRRKLSFIPPDFHLLIKIIKKRQLHKNVSRKEKRRNRLEAEESFYSLRNLIFNLSATLPHIDFQPIIITLQFSFRCRSILFILPHTSQKERRTHEKHILLFKWKDSLMDFIFSNKLLEPSFRNQFFHKLFTRSLMNEKSFSPFVFANVLVAFKFQLNFYRSIRNFPPIKFSREGIRSETRGSCTLILPHRYCTLIVS